MEAKHPATSSAQQRLGYSSLVHPQGGAVSERIQDKATFQGPHAGASLNKNNRASTAFNFNNSDIARDRGRPNALSKETTGSIYGGSIGQD